MEQSYHSQVPEPGPIGVVISDECDQPFSLFSSSMKPRLPTGQWSLTVPLPVLHAWDEPTGTTGDGRGGGECDNRRRLSALVEVKRTLRRRIPCPIQRPKDFGGAIPPGCREILACRPI